MDPVFIFLRPFIVPILPDFYIFFSLKTVPFFSFFVILARLPILLSLSLSLFFFFVSYKCFLWKDKDTGDSQ